MEPNVQGVADYANRTMQSERLRLRPVQEDELRLMEKWWNNIETLPLQTGSLLPRPDGAQLDLFRQWNSNADKASVGFAVERREDGELLGSTVLFGATFAAPVATFAIQLLPDLLGRGYGAEATRLMINYGFAALPLHRIQLQVHSFNERALRCYRSVGFVEEGVRREVTFADGRWYDEIQMSMLRPEWEARRASGEFEFKTT